VELAAPGSPETLHTNVVVEVEAVEGTIEMRLVDPRTFGFVWALTPEELAESSLARLGPDAHTGLPRAGDLASALARRSAPIKALLLDQGIVAGLGNIYADEALFRARIHPLRPGRSLDAAEVRRLRRAIRVTLDAGLRWGGTTLDDLAYLLPDGRAGDFSRRLAVYGRTGLPCRRCGTPIERVELRGRGSHFCPVCQPAT
jgi:formamidopyrimidine-DNA glycosylase